MWMHASAHAVRRELSGCDSAQRTCKDLEGVLSLVQAAQPALAARHAQPQTQCKVRQRLVPGPPARSIWVSEALST